VKKIWKFYAGKSVITRFYKQGALSRCAIQAAFCVWQSLLCMCGIVFRHMGLWFCWYWMTAMYRIVKNQDSQYCKSVLFLCGLQYCYTAFNWLIAIVFSLTFSY
jgi:hypothetical protein